MSTLRMLLALSTAFTLLGLLSYSEWLSRSSNCERIAEVELDALKEYLGSEWDIQDATVVTTPTGKVTGAVRSPRGGPSRRVYSAYRCSGPDCVISKLDSKASPSEVDAAGLAENCILGWMDLVRFPGSLRES